MAAATMQFPSSFDPPTSRPASHQGLAALSSSESPRMHRGASQAALHLPPAQAQSSMPSPPSSFAYEPLSAQQHGYSYMQYKPHPHAHYAPPTGIPIPSPQLHQSYLSGYPSSGANIAYYPGTQIYDPRSASVATPLMRTVSHAHPLTSANELTASSRYSSSPHSPSAHPVDGPASASIPPSYQWQLTATPALSVQEPQERHINPSVLANHAAHQSTNGIGYAMSRSTSGASDVAEAQRLLTPHYEHREQFSPVAADLRKVSDQLGGHTFAVRGQMADRYTPVPASAPYAQPTGQYWGRDTSVDQGYLPFSTHRASPVDQRVPQHEMPVVPETEYERQRMQNVSDNKKIFETLGLGAGAQLAMRPTRQMSNSEMRARKASKRRAIHHGNPVRSSPRIASQHRSVSYMDLDDGGAEGSDESYSGEDAYEEEDYRPAKRGRGHRHTVRKASTYDRPRRLLDLSLWGLLQVYPQIPDLFPLFYYTLNNDLSINSDSVPLIGSIPSTITPLEKANILRAYFHRGRRVLSQLDHFTSRCDRKYEGPEERWTELEHNIRIAIRDVRRKVVERCENYKYTRRDILDKHIGKHKWQAIELGMIEWRYGQTAGDPAGDLGNVTLTLPTPPPNVLLQQQQQEMQQMQPAPAHFTPDHPGQRVIRPMPSRHRLVSAAPRSVSVVMAEPTSAAHAQHSAQLFPSTAMSVPPNSSAAAGQYDHSTIPTSTSFATGPVSSTAQVPVAANATTVMSTGPDSAMMQYQQQQLLPYQRPSTSPLAVALATGAEPDVSQGFKTAASSALTSVPAWSPRLDRASSEEVKREGSIDSDLESEEA